MSSPKGTTSNGRARPLSFYSILTGASRETTPQLSRQQDLSLQPVESSTNRSQKRHASRSRSPSQELNRTIDRIEVQFSKSEPEEIEDGQEISCFGSVSTNPDHQPGRAAQAIASAGQVESYGNFSSSISVPFVVRLGETKIHKKEPERETQPAPLTNSVASLRHSDAIADQAGSLGGNVVDDNEQQANGSTETLGNNTDRTSSKAASLAIQDAPSLTLGPLKITVHDVERILPEGFDSMAQDTAGIPTEAPAGGEGLFDQVCKRQSAGSNVALSTLVGRTASVGSHTESRSRVPLFSKFYKGEDFRTTARRSIGHGAVEAELPQGSVFEGTSSEEDEDSGEEDATIENAEEVTFRRPLVVENGPTGQIDLREMLDTAPRGDAGVSKEKASEVLQQEIETQRVLDPLREPVGRTPSHRANSETRRYSKRDGVVGMPAALMEIKEDAPGNGQVTEGLVGLSIWNGIPDPFAVSQPNSHSFGPGQTPKKRRVTFPPPLNIDISPEHRSLREIIVSTPYPLGFPKEKTKKEKGASPEDNGVEAGRHTLTIIVFDNPNPKVKKILLPVKIGKVPKKAVKATAQELIDDEKLFTTIRTEYAEMQGFLPRTMSAKTVCSLKFTTYSSIPQLVDRSSKPLPFGDNQGDADFGRSSILNLYRKPRLGREQRDWVDWVSRTAKKAKTETQGKEEMALEFHKGWAGGKIALAFATVGFSSILASIIYGCLGIDGGGADGSDYRRVGGRIGRSLVLGVLTLMFGWTCIAAWILLSWRVV